MDLIVIDIIVLFGGIQALTLCLYLLFRKVEGKQAYRFFLLFLFCMALYNLGYAALFMEIRIGNFNMGMHPVPYKYIIAPALLGYVLCSLSSQPIRRTVSLLLLPALCYGLLRCYWLYMIASGKSTTIIKDAYDAGFFSINEVVILLFNLAIGVFLYRKVRLEFQKSAISFGAKQYWNWLGRLCSVFIVVSAIHLLLIIASYLVVGQHDRLFYYPSLVINSIFVYWIGFVGYSRANILFFKPLIKTKSIHRANAAVDQLLDKAMNEDKLFRNPKLTSQQLATALGLPMNELTQYINSQHEVNISQYLNKFRTQEAIDLMKGDFLERFSMEALAKEAGFNSKSSFYKVFKDQTGKTPSAYLKSVRQ